MTPLGLLGRKTSTHHQKKKKIMNESTLHSQFLPPIDMSAAHQQESVCFSGYEFLKSG